MDCVSVGVFFNSDRVDQGVAGMVMIIHLMTYFSEVIISLERFITTKFMLHQ